MRKNKNYWTKEKCQEEASKYNNRTDFYKNSSGAYLYATKENILDKVCEHMIITGNLKKRCIYSAEFNDNFVYVGLTCNFNKRISEHLTSLNSEVYKHFQIINEKPIFKQLTDYIEVNIAKEKEGEFVLLYGNTNWKLLNKAKTGALGGNDSFWTLEKCQEEALKYNSRSEFNKNMPKAYNAACKNGWLIYICEHMIRLQKPNGYWNKENCSFEALKYKTRNEYQNKSKSSYNAALKNKWLDEICLHMINPKIKWTKELCILASMKYITRNEFQISSNNEYKASVTNNWLYEICQHMPIRAKRS